MTIIIGSDVDGKRLKDLIKVYLKENDFEVLDVTEGKELDFVDSTVCTVKFKNPMTIWELPSMPMVQVVLLLLQKLKE